MGLQKFKLIRATVNYTFPFVRPLFTFEKVPERFFALCYDKTPENVPVSPSELSARFGNHMGELYARYNVFGSAAAISLHVDRLTIEVPNFSQADLQSVLPIVASVHDGFAGAFPELDFNRLDADSYSHFDVGTSAAVDKLIEPFVLTSITEIFGESVVQKPVGKASLLAADQSWSCSMALERSALQETAVFAAVNFSLRNQLPSTPFMKRAEQGRPIWDQCLAVFGLEREDAQS